MVAFTSRALVELAQAGIGMGSAILARLSGMTSRRSLPAIVGRASADGSAAALAAAELPPPATKAQAARRKVQAKLQKDRERESAATAAAAVIAHSPSRGTRAQLTATMSPGTRRALTEKVGEPGSRGRRRAAIAGPLQSESNEQPDKKGEAWIAWKGKCHSLTGDYTLVCHTQPYLSCCR